MIGWPAPLPYELNPRTGRPQLAPEFSEWLMGLPAGWITAVPGLARPAPPAGPAYDCPDHSGPARGCCTDSARRQALLRLAGNGVVPQQAAAALPWLLDQHFREVA